MSGVYRVEEPLLAQLVMLRFESAVSTLMALPVGGYSTAARSFWPDIVRDAAEAYGYDEAGQVRITPSAAQITAMDETLGWLRLIPLDRPERGQGTQSPHGGAVRRKLVALRAITGGAMGRPMGWRRIGDILGCSHVSAEVWHGRAIGQIVEGLGKLGYDERKK
jgi:hypothetical protein